METLQTDSPEETFELGRKFAERLIAGHCVALVGPLGAGKTVLVRGIACGLGVPDKRMVSSPTYVLVQEYAGRVRIYHVDLYRLTAPGVELDGLGLEEMQADGIVVIEWADRVADALPRPHWRIQIEITSRQSRSLVIQKVE
jgi:tRNA threonylcarbamoyladenosine biosynthesis protein TsaE